MTKRKLTLKEKIRRWILKKMYPYLDDYVYVSTPEETGGGNEVNHRVHYLAGACSDGSYIADEGWFIAAEWIAHRDSYDQFSSKDGE